MPLNILTGPIIAAGESLSDGIDCDGGDVVRLTLPADWTDALLTFQISTDGAFYNDLIDRYGDEISVVVVPGAAIIVPNDYLRAAGWLKFRSGSRSHPVPQQAQREFAITLATGSAVTSEPAINIKLVP
ncbi:hypothetical protein ABIF68_006794 [Bradyrhizobium japonicum]